MANSIKEYKYEAAHGSNPVYTAPDYLEGRAATDIEVWLGDSHTMDEKLVQDQHYTIDGTQVTINGVNLTLGRYIYIKRTSSPDVRLTDYVEGSLLTADTLDADANQIFYLTQEAMDEASKTNLAAGSFYHAGETAPKRIVNGVEVDPPVGTLWYNMTASPNVLEIWDGTEWYPATPLKVTSTFTQTSDEYTSGALAGLNTDYVETTNYSSKSDVYLNGVKLSPASSVANIDTDGDYFYTIDTNYLHFKSINPDDVLTVVTFAGGYSTEISQQEASMTALFSDFNAQYNDVTPKLDEVIALDIPARMLTMSGYVTAAGSYMEHAKNYATSDTDFVNELGATSKSAKQYRDLAADQVDLAANQVSLAEGEVTKASEFADLALARAQESVDPNAGWFSLDNDTIKTVSTSDPVIFAENDISIISQSGNINLNATNEGLYQVGDIIHNTNKLPFATGIIDLDDNDTWKGYANVQLHKSSNVFTLNIDDLGDNFGVHACYMVNGSGSHNPDMTHVKVRKNEYLPHEFSLSFTSINFDGTTIESISESIPAYGKVMVTVYKY